MNRSGWSIGIIFTAVALLYIPVLFDEAEETKQDDDKLGVAPNYQAVNLNSKLYDREGRLSHQVVADKMEHYEELGFAVFDNPVYTLFLDNGEPWQVTAAEATLTDDNNIKLEKNVKIVNLRSQEYVQQITTEYIRINLLNKTLYSDQLVEITGVDYTVKSIGLEGDLLTQQYELKKHVQTQFNPRR